MPKPTNVHPTASKASSEAGAELETSPKRARRNFTAAEKLRILAEADACSARGEREALMRREGIYSSHLSNWRAQRKARGSEGLAGAKPETVSGISGAIHQLLDAPVFGVAASRSSTSLRSKYSAKSPVVSAFRLPRRNAGNGTVGGAR